jgi:hypothetical protein
MGLGVADQGVDQLDRLAEVALVVDLAAPIVTPGGFTVFFVLVLGRTGGAFRLGGASDGTRILSESFRINRRQAGWMFAIRSVLESRFRYWIWKTGNLVLRTLLGEDGFHRFKARNIKNQG